MKITAGGRGQPESRPQGCRGLPCGPCPASGWCYLQSEVSGGEGHLGEANGPLDVMIAPEDGNTLC